MDAVLTAPEPEVEAPVVPLAPVRAVLAMPVGYFVESTTMDSLWRAAARYGRDQLAYDQEDKGDIDKARNILADRALKRTPRPDYIIFVDHDAGVPIGDPKWYRRRFGHTLPDRYGRHNFFTRLLAHPPAMGIVGAAYFQRMDGGEAVCSLGLGGQQKGFSDQLRKGAARGLMPCDWIGFGGTRVALWVLDRLHAEQHRWPEIISKKNPPRALGLFNKTMADVSEDVAFCLRAKTIGIQTYIDCELRLVHTGKKHYT